MIALVIVAVILVLLLAVMLLPVGVFMSYEEEFSFKIKFAGITVYKPKESNQVPTEKQGEDKNEPKKKAKGFFDRMVEKYGFSGAIKELFAFVGEVLSHMKRFLRHIKLKKVKLFVTVGNFDAALTAISYGAVCSAVYPVLELLQSLVNISYKKIDIKSDFESCQNSFSFQAVINLRIFFLCIAAFKIFKSYKNFITRIEEK